MQGMLLLSETGLSHPFHILTRAASSTGKNKEGRVKEQREAQNIKKNNKHKEHKKDNLRLPELGA
jgi:hypothetical protein